MSTDNNLPIHHRAAVQATYASASDDAEFSPDVASIITGYSEDALAAMRSRGGGPKFRKIGRSIFYPKRDLKAWIRNVSVEASNTAEARLKAGELQAVG